MNAKSDFQEKFSELKEAVEKELRSMEFQIKQILHPSSHQQVEAVINEHAGRIGGILSGSESAAPAPPAPPAPDSTGTGQGAGSGSESEPGNNSDLNPPAGGNGGDDPSHQDDDDNHEDDDQRQHDQD